MERHKIQKNGQARRKHNYLIYSIPIYLLLLLVLLDAFVAPFLESRRLAISADFYAALRPICHQWPTRCLWVFGSNTALCTRCLGIFAGLLLTGIFLAIKQQKRILWKTAIFMNLPAFIDGYSQLKDWRMSNNFLRLGTGLLAGIGAGAFLFPFFFKMVIVVQRFLKRIFIRSPESELGL